MRQFLAISLAMLVLGVLLVGPAHAGDKDKSPEDVFKAYAAAMKKDDVKAGMSYLTRESQTVLAGVMSWALYVGKNYLDKDVERLKMIEETLKRHNLSVDDAVRKIEEEEFNRPPKTTEDLIRLLLTLGAMVKDKPALVSDVLKSSILGKAWAQQHLGKDIGKAKISEVKIDGQKAKGVATMLSAEGKETTDTVYFKLENGAWKIDGIETVCNRPDPRPAAPQVQPPAPRAEPPTGPVRRLFWRLRGG